MSERAGTDVAWDAIRARFRERGMRWTAQRRVVIEALSRTEGHVTGAALVVRCRQADPTIIPSTVYRTLDALEDLGLVRHGHGADGREEFHVGPVSVHGHRYCAGCGESWEIGAVEADVITQAFRATDGFEVDMSHVTVVGRCSGCAEGG